jgi:hypothetical protein
MVKGSDGVDTLSQTSAAMVTPLIVGEVYRLSYELTSYATGYVTPTCGGVTLDTAGYTATGATAVSCIFTALSTADLIFTPSNTSRFTLDNVSLRRIVGGATYACGTVGVQGNLVFTPGTAYGISKLVDDLTITTAAQKTVVLATTVWDDINLGGATLHGNPTVVPAVSQIVDNLGANTGIYTYSFTLNQAVSGCFELKHDYKEGSDVTPHVHFHIQSAPAGGTDNIKWQIKYTFARDGVTFAPVTTIVKEMAVTTQYASYRADFTAITGTNLKIGDQCCFNLSRIAASADDFAGDLYLQTVGLHYQIDTIGSRQIGTK